MSVHPLFITKVPEAIPTLESLLHSILSSAEIVVALEQLVVVWQFLYSLDVLFSFSH